MGLMWGLSIVMAFVLSFFLINFNNGPGQEGEFDTFKHGAFHGAFIGVIIVAPTFIANGFLSKKPGRTCSSTLATGSFRWL